MSYVAVQYNVVDTIKRVFILELIIVLILGLLCICGTGFEIYSVWNSFVIDQPSNAQPLHSS